MIEGGQADELTARRYAYFYNPNRSLTQMQDNDPARPEGDRDRFTNISRDPAERELVVNETWPKGKDTVFSYDDAGNVATRKTDGAHNAASGDYGDAPNSTDKAKSTSFSYDRLDRERSATITQASKTRSHEKNWWPSAGARIPRHLWRR